MMVEYTIPRLTILYTFKQMREITLAKHNKEVEEKMKSKRLNLGSDKHEIDSILKDGHYKYKT